jgi:hypothetical protein
MTALCWEKKKNNGKFCKNYKLNSKTKCRHHNVNSYLNMHLMVSFLMIMSYYYYSQNESEINLYIYMTINNICKNINEFGYNICISLETYLENYRKIYNHKMLIKQNLKIFIGYDLQNVKMYVKDILVQLNVNARDTYISIYNLYHWKRI